MIPVKGEILSEREFLMGIYLNPNNMGFWESTNSKIYVDKTGMIAFTNGCMYTEQKFICISRPRRFGKSMALKMLAAYYSRGCDSRELFSGYKIAKDAGFGKYLNKYNVIYLNMQQFLSEAKQGEMLGYLQKEVREELLEEYGDILRIQDGEGIVLSALFRKIYAKSGIPFVFLIDEWDCVMREKQEAEELQKQYLDFLRNLLKDQSYVALAYMTGILPIKKYGSHSALNMFQEFSMTNPRELEEYVGFTQKEVECICDRFGRDFEMMRLWYDGYSFLREKSVYNPKAVVEAALSGVYDSYWTKTETYEALRDYIGLNYDGLRDSVTAMLAGDRRHINTGKFCNDMTHFDSADDVMTLLIHLGYLAYDFEHEEVYIPNREISKEFYNAVEGSGWNEVIKAVQGSRKLLEAIWNLDERTVAEGIEAAHYETSYLQYNDENALSYTLSLALYAARQYYFMVRELPTGKGFADIVFIPFKDADKPALVVELKVDRSADTAIEQIKKKKYAQALKGYSGDIFLVGVSYDKRTKRHECKIMRYNFENEKDGF